MTTDAIDLSGQVALITGGGRGLGRAFAQALPAAGAAVSINARTQSQLEETVKLIEESGDRVIAFTPVFDPILHYIRQRQCHDFNSRYSGLLS